MLPCPIIIFLYTKNWHHSLECLATFPGMFDDIPLNVWRHSPEYLATFSGMFSNIPRNVWGNSPECLATFRGMFEEISPSVWRHSPECLRTFPEMFSNIPRNVWRHSSEYNIPPIPRVPRIPFPVPVFLVLVIALKSSSFYNISNFHYGFVWDQSKVQRSLFQRIAVSFK